MVKEKWQTVNLESCITWEQQGFICKGNTIDAKDICLDAEQGICHFKIHPDTTQKMVLIYIGQGWVCLRTACTFVEINNNKFFLKTILIFVFIILPGLLGVTSRMQHQLYPISW